jgi:hypothetical protein
VQFEVVAQSSLLELALALVVRHDGNVDLLEDVLVLAKVAEGVLAPAGGVAARSSEFGVWIRQTSSTDVRTETENKRW